MIKLLKDARFRFALGIILFLAGTNSVHLVKNLSGITLDVVAPLVLLVCIFGLGMGIHSLARMKSGSQ